MIERVKKAQQILKENKIFALLISNPINIFFLTGVLFPIEEREGFLLLTPEQIYLFTDPRNSATFKQIPYVTLIETTAKASFLKNIKDIAKTLRLRRMAFEANNLTFSEYVSINKQVKLFPFDEIVEQLRLIKEESEIKSIQKACQIGDEAFQVILSNIKEGVTEIELAKKLETIFREKGAISSFPPIVAFGKNSAVPHHKVTDKSLENNEVVLLDFGARYENYCSDMTRTLILGQVDNRFLNMYSTVLKAQSAAIEKVKVSVKASEVDHEARHFITTQGFDLIPHSTGHGIGLEVHESPNISPGNDEKLKEDTIFSIEPGIYVEGFCGVRIEDLVLLDKGGAKLLTNSNRSLIEL